MARSEGGRDAALSYLRDRKAAISEELRRITRERGSVLAAVSAGGRELLDRIQEFCLRGKMLRGALVGLGSLLFSEAEPPGSVQAAAAMELFQAGLLVHDDIMDGDDERRGAPTLHRAYASESAAAGACDSESYRASDRAGESLAICAGDVCFFEGFAELGRAIAYNPGAAEAYRLCAEELSVVGLAQMSDVGWSALAGEPSEDEILAMYRCKTARYTFSMPLAVAAVLAGRADAVPALYEIGGEMGIAFQLRDDELGIFGDPALTGKSASTDIREGKKTLFRARLFARSEAGELPRLRAAFSRGAAEGEIAFARARIEGLGIRAGIAAEARAAAARAERLISALPGARAPGAELLKGLLDYVTAREA
jgi:geranylgeranyl diphosphate synthase type I